jgi:RNA polymerase sigma factor (sigma-70 family)
LSAAKKETGLICRSLVSNHADAEDAFQATFLVLARRAGSIRNKGSLASWLYGVAYRTCLKVRAAQATRQHHEAQVPSYRQPEVVDVLSWREAQCILHQELARLPEKYRAPLVLCYLEGKRQDEAERLLGWPPGKLRSMLERARQRLRTELVRRGLGPSAVLLVTVGQARSIPPPGQLVTGAVRAAAALTLTPAAPQIVSAKVLALTETVIQSMTCTRSSSPWARCCWSPFWAWRRQASTESSPPSSTATGKPCEIPGGIPTSYALADWRQSTVEPGQGSPHGVALLHETPFLCFQRARSACKRATRRVTTKGGCYEG